MIGKKDRRERQDERKRRLVPALVHEEGKKLSFTPDGGMGWDWDGSTRSREHAVAHVVPHVLAFFSLKVVSPRGGPTKEKLRGRGRQAHLQVAMDSGGVPNQRVDRFGVPGRLILSD